VAAALKERGFFWWFNEPNLPARSQDTSVPGLLTITDDGQITLETDGSLCLKDEYQNLSEPHTLPASRRILGLLASSDNNDRYILLEGLERTDLSFFDELPQQQQFSAQLCTSRNSPFPDAYPQGFTELRIALDGFEDWLKLESIIVSPEYRDDDKVQVRVTYKEWKFEYAVPPGRVSIESVTTGTIPFMPDLARTSAEFRQHFYLVFTPDSPINASHLHYLYSKIEEFLAILIGTYHRLPWPIFTTKDEFDTWNTVYSYRDAPVRPVNRFSIWITFSKIQKMFGDLFKNWLSGSESFGAGYYLYISGLRNPHQYSEHRFVNLVWAVEALHRKWLAESETSERVISERKRIEEILDLLSKNGESQKWLREKLAYAHELSLRKRILECFRKLPFTFGHGEIEKFAKDCANRRNDISHLGGPRENVDYDSFHSEISGLADVLDHLFHALLLHQIGVDARTLGEVMTDSAISWRVKAALEKIGLSMKSIAELEGASAKEGT
jgi:hypothetical protein